MYGWLRRSLVVVLAVLAATYSHEPLLGVGFLGADARTLVELDTALQDEGLGAYWRVDALHGRPLAAWSLSLSKALHGSEGRYTPGDAGRLRIEGLALLVLAALGLRVAVRRGLAPWTGDEHGRAAGFTALVLLLVHPLAIPAAAHLGDRGDMLALAIGLWAVAAYLAFRQVHSRVGIAVPWLATVACAASSPMAYGLPIVLAVLELASADRHRDLRRRVRTGATTLAAFTLAVLLERVVRALVGGEASHTAHVDRSPLALLGVAAEKLGVLLLPVNTTGVGMFGYVLAVLTVLAVLHPGFVAARAAPRLWGRILGSWAACIVALLVLTWSSRSAPAELGDARALLSGAALMAAGLGVASTALSGARRTLLPGLAIAVYAPLAAGNAATIEEAAERVGELHAALLDVGDDRGWDCSVVVLDPPRKVAGVTALRPGDEPALVARPFLPATGRPFEVFGLPSEALRLWAEGSDFERARDRGLTLLSAPRERGESVGERDAFALPNGRGAVGALSWVGDGASPDGVAFDPLRARALIALPRAEPTRSSGAPQMRFQGDAVGAEDRVLAGAWVRSQGRWAAHFDLERRLEWTFAGTVRGLWLPGALALADEVRVLPALPELAAGLRPRAVGDDWIFDHPVEDLLAAQGALSWVLATWNPTTRVYDERPAVPDGGRLRVAGLASARGVRWSLERRVDDVTVACARGDY